MSAVFEAFAAVVNATTDDPTGHLPNCGYTFENETCGCATWGERLHGALTRIVAAAEQRGRAEVTAAIEAVLDGMPHATDIGCADRFGGCRCYKSQVRAALGESA